MSFDLNKCTEKTRKIIQNAQQVARDLKNIEFHPIHIVLSLLEDSDAFVPNILSQANLDAKNLTRSIKKRATKLPSQDPPPANINASKHTLEVLNKALELSKEHGDSFVAADHLFLACLKDSTVASEINSMGLTVSDIEKIVNSSRGKKKVESQTGEENFEALSKYGQDLVQAAKDGKLDPVIGLMKK